MEPYGVKMTLNASRVAKITHCDVSAKYKHMLALYLVGKHNRGTVYLAILGKQYTHLKTHKLLQVCKHVVTNMFTSCRQVVFALPLLVPSCCNKFGTSC
jgi:hypothetical protein